MSNRSSLLLIATGRLCTLLLWCLCGLASAADMVPYLQTPAANSIWVSWKTSTAGNSVVEYGTSATALTSQATGSAAQQLATNYYFHGVKVSGLSADSLYHYRIRTGSQVSPVYRFRTQPASTTVSGKYRILVVGDHQIRDQNRHGTLLAAARAKIQSTYGRPLEEVVNIIINDGDQVDVGTLDHWENLHFAQSAPMSPNVPIMTTLGNHETYYDTGLANWKAHFFRENLAYRTHVPGPDERYYANHVGRVLFIHMDSEAPNTTQKNWVQAVINTAAADPEVDWIISVLHRPYQAEQYVGDISSWLRTEVMPILSSTRKHVLNIAGHHHLYARGQTRDYPTYHMISGGTAWDQYWGQSTEQDFNDVQKTIANWTWQLIEIDVASKEMTVRSFSEAHPKLGFVYSSRQTDEFHRNLNQGPPLKPALANSIAAPITLPYTFTSTSFVSNYGEQLNTTQFQIARDASFASVVMDSVRDYENIYGDTGAPLYEPVDIGATVNILSFQVASLGLSNGSYFARVRHRDRNVEWSPWSDSRAFTVTGSSSGNPLLTLAKRVFSATEAVVVQHVNGTGNARDWVGIYRKGQVPGQVSSTKFSYVASPNGQVSFTGLTAGVEYYVAFFTNDTYVEIAPRVPLYVGSVPSVALAKTALAVGESAVATWTNAPAGSTDRIAIYRVGQLPALDSPTQFRVTATASGTATFAGLAKGYYYATFIVNAGDFEIIERLPFSVGDRIGTISMPSIALAINQDFTVTFSNGPGVPKDYLGVFRLGSTPGVDQLVTYSYVGGLPQGSVTITENLPQGNYFVALFTNDSYTEVSNRIDFAVGNSTLPPPTPTFSLDKGQYLDTEGVTVRWTNTPGQASDYVAVYRAGEVPGVATPARRANLTGPSGQLTLNPLPAGSYFAGVYSATSTTELAPRALFKVIKPGDISGDGRVDITDRELLRAAMGSCLGQPRYLPAANFDSDTCITQQDYKLWYDIYNRQIARKETK
jgi:hypothetical protein